MKNTLNLPKFKKDRDKARNALNEAINKLCQEHGLNRFEVTHAIIDKAFINAESAYTPHTLTPGLAETYFDHTIRVAEQEKAEPAAVTKGKKGLGAFIDDSVLMPSWSLQDAVDQVSNNAAESVKAKWAAYKDDLYKAKYSAKTIKKVPLQATKNQADWIGKWTQPSVPVGGTIAKKTVDYYGYKLPPGYVFVPTTWGGEYTVEEEVKEYQLINSGGFPVTVPLGQYLSKSWMQQYDLWDLNLPDGVKWTGPGPSLPNGDSSWALVYTGQDKPIDHEPLDVDPVEPAKPFPGYPIFGHWCGKNECLDITLSPGQTAKYSGQFLASKGIKFHELEKFGPKGLTYTPIPSQDMIVIAHELPLQSEAF